MTLLFFHVKNTLEQSAYLILFFKTTIEPTCQIHDFSVFIVFFILYTWPIYTNFYVYYFYYLFFNVLFLYIFCFLEIYSTHNVKLVFHCSNCNIIPIFFINTYDFYYILLYISIEFMIYDYIF
jgi:hypothetical protein